MVCEVPGETEEVIVFMAHTDTVFPDREPMPYHEENGRMFCPGIGDDTANLAVLLMLARYVLTRGLRSRYTVVFAANSCEEGLGNLKGSFQLMKDYGSRTVEVVSFDGYYSGVANDAVGSTRYEVTVRTEGGHSFGNFGNRQCHSPALPRHQRSLWHRGAHPCQNHLQCGSNSRRHLGEHHCPGCLDAVLIPLGGSGLPGGDAPEV